ncbi:MAG TPA: HAMP domain-containing sensor histidine kinase [Thermoanaerobaculia bacterium]|nr:HAMP domain-containing sensor histidine kinase [Thermoanaerobaculia bacterium]
MSNRIPERRSIWRVGPDSTWTTVVPVVFIIVSLLTLALLPVVFGLHTAQMRSEITGVAEPSRLAANKIESDLSTELDEVIAWQVTGQRQFRDKYTNLLDDQRQQYARLLQLGPKLGPEVRDRLRSLHKETSEWHQDVASSEFLTRQMPAEVFLTRLFEKHPSYDEALVSAAELEVAIQEAIDYRRTKIRDAEKLSASLEIILTLLALTSALLVAGLGRQMRLLAREAMARRHEAEHDAADAQRARAAAESEERRAAFLATAGQELAASLDYEHAIATLARLIVPNIAEICVIDLAESDGGLRRAAVAHRDAEREKELAAHVGEVVLEVPEALALVIRERQTRIIGQASSLLVYAGVSAEEQRSLMAVPLVSRGQTLGVILAAAAESKPFTREDASLLGELSRHGSLSIDNARLYLESQQAVQAREEVLAIVSHDLRSPLNAVMLAASLLQTSDRIAPQDREELEIIDISAKRMRRLIEDLLDVTRLEGGKRLPIEPAPLSVESLFSETYELFKSQAATSSITLQYQAGDGVPQVFADQHRVLQVLSNLIGNAMKFTPPGGMITYRAEPQDASVRITVADNGPGIPKENLGDIFNPYWQAKRTARLGAGLGLPIAKGIVESHGGRMWVESEPGNGTKFFFTLPVAVNVPSAATPATAR